MQHRTICCCCGGGGGGGGSGGGIGGVPLSVGN